MKKIPVFRTALDTFKDTYGAIGALCRMSLVWFVLYLALGYLSYAAYVDYLDVRFFQSYGFKSIRYQEVAVTFLLYMAGLSLLGFAYMGVVIHAGLKGEAGFFRFGRAEGLFFVKYTLLYVLSFVAAAVIMTFAFYVVLKVGPVSLTERVADGLQAGELSLAYALWIIPVLLLGYTFIVRGLMMAVSTFDASRISLIGSWKLTRGNTVRMLLVTAFVSVPLLAVQYVFSREEVAELYSGNIAWYLLYLGLVFAFLPLYSILAVKIYRFLQQS